MLQGTASYGYKATAQGYNIILEYTSDSNTININEWFQVFVNPFVEENSYSKDFNYHLNYGFDARDVFAKSVIDINKRNGEYNLDLKAPDNKPFELVDANGNPIADLSNLFHIHHHFYDGGILRGILSPLMAMSGGVTRKKIFH